jgi:hypothetical protein
LWEAADVGQEPVGAGDPVAELGVASIAAETVAAVAGIAVVVIADSGTAAVPRFVLAGAGESKPSRAQGIVDVEIRVGLNIWADTEVRPGVAVAAAAAPAARGRLRAGAASCLLSPVPSRFAVYSSEESQRQSVVISVNWETSEI